MFHPTKKDANVIIFCSDPRVIKWLNNKKCRNALGLTDSFGTIAETGSIKFFLNENLIDKLFKQLDILVGHFHPNKIIILNHTDCGYYKSLNQDEEKFYLADLKTARELLGQKYSLEIETYLLDTETGELKK